MKRKGARQCTLFDYFERKDATDLIREIPIPTFKWDWNLIDYVDNVDFGDWNYTLKKFAYDELKEISEILIEQEKRGYRLCPQLHRILFAFQSTPLKSIKCVITGYDPYPQFVGDQPRARGLAFSVSKEDVIPDSLDTVYEELMDNYTSHPQYFVRPFVVPTHGCLESWIHQGIFLFNSALTTTENEPGHHSKNPIWTGFTNKVIRTITSQNPNCIFLLWGQQARMITKMLKSTITKYTAPHPSSKNDGKFLGCGHFWKVNRKLSKTGEKMIDWNV